MSTRGRITGLTLVTAGVATILVAHWMMAVWVPNEASQGVVQRIFYVHVPAAWTMFIAVAVVAVASAVYLWLMDERADAAAVAAGEGALIFGAIMLISGPLWGRLIWDTYWEWEPRLTLSLLLWFTYLGYFMVRGSVADPGRAKRFAAVVAVVGSLNIPLIHVSVEMFRSLHPGPVVMNPEGPTLPADMLVTLLTMWAGFVMLFLGLFTPRYAIEGLRGLPLPAAAGETAEALI